MAWEFNNDLPIYLQIAEQIKQFIASGELKPGDKIPTVRDYAIIAGVNPNTMQKALSHLERENILFANRTSGRYVSEDVGSVKKMKEELAKQQIINFVEQMKRIGLTNKDIMVSIKLYLEEGINE